MSLLASIQRGRAPVPPRILLYGVEGIGKSTFGAQSPKPIFVQTEDGLSQIDCDKFPLATSIDEVRAALTELYVQPHDYETTVIDSLDWLERLIWDAVCKEHNVKSIEKADGGYAKGYVHAVTYWRQIVDLLNALRNEKGMAVILIAHTKVEKFRGSGVVGLRPLLAAAAQACRGPDLRVVRRGAVRHAEVPHTERRRRLQPQADHRQPHRQGWRRAHPPLRRGTVVHRQESLRNRRGTAALVGGVRPSLIQQPTQRRSCERWLIYTDSTPTRWSPTPPSTRSRPASIWRSSRNRSGSPRRPEPAATCS